MQALQGHQQKLKHDFIDDGMCDFDDVDGEEQDISYSYLVSHDDNENDEEFLQHWTKKIEEHKSHQSYINLEDQRSFEDIQTKAKEILNEAYSNNMKIDYVDPEQLNKEQKLFYNIIVIIMKTFFLVI